jgi:CRP-like cAMP-binding protein
MVGCIPTFAVARLFESGSHPRGLPMFNHILLALSAEDRAVLLRSLARVDLTPGQKLELPNNPIQKVFFVDTGIAAVLVAIKGESVALGLIGCEGATGIAIMLGNDKSPHATVMLTEGTGYLIGTDELRDLMDKRPELQRLLLRYCLAFHNQAAHTALSNAATSIEERVARWIVMAHDRTPANEIPITHEGIAHLLDVRRAGVSEALQKLQSDNLISLSRKCVTLLDREAMQAKAGKFYGAPEQEYVRLIGTYWPPMAQIPK